MLDEENDANHTDHLLALDVNFICNNSRQSRWFRKKSLPRVGIKLHLIKPEDQLYRININNFAGKGIRDF